MALTAFKLMVTHNCSGLAVVNAAGELVDTVSVRDLRGMGATAENWTNLWSSVAGQLRKTKTEGQNEGRGDRYRCARCDLSSELSSSAFCVSPLPVPWTLNLSALRVQGDLPREVPAADSGHSDLRSEEGHAREGHQVHGRRKHPQNLRRQWDNFKTLLHTLRRSAGKAAGASALRLRSAVAAAGLSPF